MRLLYLEMIIEICLNFHSIQTLKLTCIWCLKNTMHYLYLQMIIEICVTLYSKQK